MSPFSLSSRLTSATVAFSGTVMVISSSGLVSASTSSASRHPNTASSTDAASTQHTYKSTFTPAARCARCGCSSCSGCSSESRLRSAYSSGSFGSNGSLCEGFALSSVSSSRDTSPACGAPCWGAGSCASSCCGRREVPIIWSMRAISSLVDAISSSMDIDEKSSCPSSG